MFTLKQGQDLPPHPLRFLKLLYNIKREGAEVTQYSALILSIKFHYKFKIITFSPFYPYPTNLFWKFFHCQPNQPVPAGWPPWLLDRSLCPLPYGRRAQLQAWCWKLNVIWMTAGSTLSGQPYVASDPTNINPSKIIFFLSVPNYSFQILSRIVTS